MPDLFVKAYDRDLVFDDLLGTAMTGPDGSFEIVSESPDFRGLFEVRPDLYLRVYRPDRTTQIWTSEECVRWNAGRYETFDVRIPGHAVPNSGRGPSIALVGSPRQAPDAPQAGDALVVRMSGLRPSTLYSISAHDETGETFSQSILSDARGEVHDAVVWAQIGLDDPRSKERLPVDALRARWLGRTIELVLRDGDRMVAKRIVAIDGQGPLAVATDEGRRILNGFEIGEADRCDG